MSWWWEVDSLMLLKQSQRGDKLSLSNYTEITKRLIHDWFFMHVRQSVKATKGWSSYAVTQTSCCFSFTSCKKMCWKVFENEPLLVNGIGRGRKLSPGEQFVCHLYGATIQSNVDQARLQLFSKAKKGLEIAWFQCGQTTSNHRCLSLACHLCMQIQMPDSLMQLLLERSLP